MEMRGVEEKLSKTLLLIEDKQDELTSLHK